MKFTLQYRAELPGGNCRPAKKHILRTAFHKQLKLLWENDVRLNKIVIEDLKEPIRTGKQFDVERPISGHQHFWWRYPLCGHNFVPLVTHVHELHCHLDIRLARQGLGHIFEGGDIDNRLKPLFDALRMPHAADELPPTARLEETDQTKEWPIFFCLLDDDSAVTRLSIESIKLLRPVPDGLTHPSDYAELDIDVTIEPVGPMMGNLDMLFR